MKFCIYLMVFWFVTVSSLSFANSPPEPQTWGGLPAVSADVGDSVYWDVSGSFSDPDGDTLTYFMPNWSNPLPAGLSLDENTGVISGTLASPLAGVGTSVRIGARDPDGLETPPQWLGIWKPLTHGAFTDLFFRECVPEEYMCIPGYAYNGWQLDPPRNDLNTGRPTPVSPDLSQSSSQYPDAPEATRMAASVGYEGAELTPAISMFMYPANERMTGDQSGYARHFLSADVTIMAELTYSQSGGILAPAMPPLPEELPFGAITGAQLYAFQLAPSANGVLDFSRCDWVAAGFGGDPWGGPSPRAMTDCLRRGIHLDVIELQIVDFPIPEVGDFSIPGNGTVTSAVSSGSTTAEIFVERDPGLVEDPEVFIVIAIQSLARYGGFVDSANTLRIAFDNPQAVEPAMPEVVEPTFEPAPQSGGEVLINNGMCINLNGHGRILVVIKGGEFMDANLIDHESIDFAGLELATRGPATRPKLACSIDDHDLDSFDDLICQFLDDPYLWTGGVGGATAVTWNLVNSLETYSGFDWVCLE